MITVVVALFVIIFAFFFTNAIIVQKTKQIIIRNIGDNAMRIIFV